MVYTTVILQLAMFFCTVGTTALTPRQYANKEESDTEVLGRDDDEHSYTKREFNTTVADYLNGVIADELAAGWEVPFWELSEGNNTRSIKWLSKQLELNYDNGTYTLNSLAGNFTLQSLDDLFDTLYDNRTYSMANDLQKRYTVTEYKMNIVEFIKNNVNYDNSLATLDFINAFAGNLVAWAGSSNNTPKDRVVTSIGNNAYLAIVDGDSGDNFNSGCFENIKESFGSSVGVPSGTACIRVTTQNSERAWTALFGQDFNGVKGASCVSYNVQEVESTKC